MKDKTIVIILLTSLLFIVLTALILIIVVEEVNILICIGSFILGAIFLNIIFFTLDILNNE